MLASRIFRYFQSRLLVIPLILGAGLASPLCAAGPSPGKYPLRVYIFNIGSRPIHGHEPKHPSDMPDYLSGSGQADFFEGGEPHAFQFTFNCTAGMIVSAGYVTFPARWRKRDKTLEMLLPQKGSLDSFEPCDLQVELVPNLAYFWKNGALAAGPAGPLMDWMKKHHFDPESGSDEPMLLPGDTPDTDPFRSPE